MSAIPLATLTPEESISEAHSAIYDPTAGDAKRPDGSALFHEALTQPGLLSDAYQSFHRYSAANAMLIALQARFRGLQLSPVASFKGWLNKGDAVKKGEEALAMVMPVTVSVTARRRAGHAGPDRLGGAVQHPVWQESGQKSWRALSHGVHAAPQWVPALAGRARPGRSTRPRKRWASRYCRSRC